MAGGGAGDGDAIKSTSKDYRRKWTSTTTKPVMTSAAAMMADIANTTLRNNTGAYAGDAGDNDDFQGGADGYTNADGGGGGGNGMWWSASNWNPFMRWSNRPIGYDPAAGTCV